MKLYLLCIMYGDNCGFLVVVNDIPGHTHYLYYDQDNKLIVSVTHIIININIHIIHTYMHNCVL